MRTSTISLMVLVLVLSVGACAGRQVRARVSPVVQVTAPQEKVTLPEAVIQESVPVSSVAAAPAHVTAPVTTASLEEPRVAARVAPVESRVKTRPPVRARPVRNRVTSVTPPITAPSRSSDPTAALLRSAPLLAAPATMPPAESVAAAAVISEPKPVTPASVDSGSRRNQESLSNARVLDILIGAFLGMLVMAIPIHLIARRQRLQQHQRLAEVMNDPSSVEPAPPLEPPDLAQARSVSSESSPQPSAAPSDHMAESNSSKTFVDPAYAQTVPPYS